MICPGCGAKSMTHAGAQTDNPPCARWPRCPRCGEANNGGKNYEAGVARDICEELGICYRCAIGEERARAYASGKSPHTLIIDGYTYSADPTNTVALGKPDSRPGAQMRGMAGRRFDFRRFDGSEPRTTYSLWSGGPVDKWSRDRMRDNAEFLNGAERVQVGETTCFNQSRADPHRIASKEARHG